MRKWLPSPPTAAATRMTVRGYPLGGIGNIRVNDVTDPYDVLLS